MSDAYDDKMISCSVRPILGFFMKSYVPDNIASCDQAVVELRRLLPGQENPWLLNAAGGSPIAYFNVCLDEGAAYVSADMSGRHYNEDDRVRSILQQLRTIVGGTISLSP